MSSRWSYKDVYCEAQGAEYAPGDILNLIPSQNAKSVDAFLNRCNLDPNIFVTVEASGCDVYSTGGPDELGNLSKRTAVPVRTLVEALMDIDSASPRRYLFEVMSHFAKEERERERLQYFATPEGRDDLYRYNQRERRTVLEVLQDFPSVQVQFMNIDMHLLVSPVGYVVLVLVTQFHLSNLSH